MNDKVNILLVDDQPSRLLSYEAILGELGQNLVRANSGQEALQRADEGRLRGGAARRQHARDGRIRNREPDSRSPALRENADHLRDRRQHHRVRPPEGLSARRRRLRLRAGRAGNSQEQSGGAGRTALQTSRTAAAESVAGTRQSAPRPGAQHAAGREESRTRRTEPHAAEAPMRSSKRRTAFSPAKWRSAVASKPR